jgi:hypothetical protein
MSLYTDFQTKTAQFIIDRLSTRGTKGVKGSYDHFSKDCSVKTVKSMWFDIEQQDDYYDSVTSHNNINFYATCECGKFKNVHASSIVDMDDVLNNLRTPEDV